MKAREFCYWLQGYFELSGTNADLDARQWPIVEAHLRLVAAADPDHDNAFVAWLAASRQPESAKVRRLLASQFRHEIDPSYPFLGQPAGIIGAGLGAGAR